jgi:hypothetical protein
MWQIAAWSFITAFCGLSVVQGIFNYSDYFKEHNVPGIVASYVSRHAITPTQALDLTQPNRAHLQSWSSALLKAHSLNRAP